MGSLMRIGIRPSLLGAVVAAVCVNATPASAQVVLGRVVDAATATPLADASVILFDSTNVEVARTHSDERGRFVFQLSGPGVFQLEVSLFGFEATNSAPFRTESDSIEVDIALVAAPVQIDPLLARGESRKPKLVASGFYARQERGFGSYLEREHIDGKAAILITDLLRSLPGVRVVRAGLGGSSFDVLMPGARTMFFRDSESRESPGNRTCYPSVAIDGVIVRRGGQDGEAGEWVHMVSPNDVEGIEVYTSGAGLPVQVAGPISPCGSILIWTRRDG